MEEAVVIVSGNERDHGRTRKIEDGKDINDREKGKEKIEQTHGDTVKNVKSVKLVETVNTV